MRIGGPQVINENSLAHINLIGEPSVGAPVEGDLWYDGTSFNFRDSSLTIDMLLQGASEIQFGQATRTLGDSNEDVAYTNVGFKPTHIMFIFGLNAGGPLEVGGWGMDDGPSPGDVSIGFSNQGEDTAGKWTFRVSSNMDFTIGPGANRAIAAVKTFDTDGFTLTWSAGPASGGNTGFFSWLAFK